MSGVYRSFLPGLIGLGYILEMSIYDDKPQHTFEELQEATWEELIQWGLITPAKDKFDPKVFEPLPNPKGLNLLAEFLRERREARY
jgi:hypothetical protein